MKSKEAFENEKRELSAYQRMLKECSLMESKIKKLRATIESIGGGIGGEHIDGGLPHSKSTAIAELVDIEDEWCKMLRRSEMKCLEIKRKIDNVSAISQISGLILAYRYIDGFTFEKISVQINYAFAHTYRLYENGLRIYRNITNKSKTEAARTEVRA